MTQRISRRTVLQSSIAADEKAAQLWAVSEKLVADYL